MARGECALVGVVPRAARFYYTANSRDSREAKNFVFVVFFVTSLPSYRLLGPLIRTLYLVGPTQTGALQVT